MAQTFTRQRQRGATEAEILSSGDVPLEREIVVAYDTGSFWVGNGVDAPTGLPQQGPIVASADGLLRLPSGELLPAIEADTSSLPMPVRQAIANAVLDDSSPEGRAVATVAAGGAVADAAVAGFVDGDSATRAALDEHFEQRRNTAQPLNASLLNVARAISQHNDASTDTLRVIGLGSSVGVGATLPDPASQAPVARLAAVVAPQLIPLGNVPYAVTNGSVNGSTVFDGLDSAYTAAKTAAGGAPALAVLAFGMNDGMPEQYHRGQTLDGMIASARSLIRRVQADGGDVIVFTTPHPRTDVMTDSSWSLSGPSTYPSGTPIPAPTSAASVVQVELDDGTLVPASYRHLRVNEALRQIAAETGAVLLDAERYWFEAVATVGLASLFDVGEYAHPNLRGHQLSYWKAIDDFARSYRQATVAAAGIPATQTPTTVSKPDNRAYQSTTTLAGDVQLSVPAAKGATYRVTVVAFYTGSVGADLRIGLTLPAGSAGSAGVEGAGTNAAAYGGDTSTFRRVALPDTYGLPVGCNGADAMARLTGIVHAGADGTIAAAFCQDTSTSAPTTVYADSYMTVERIG